MGDLQRSVWACPVRDTESAPPLPSLSRATGSACSRRGFGEGAVTRPLGADKERDERGDEHDG
jgi:hypothetical protein